MCSRNCSVDNCTNSPLFVCNCEVIPTLICERHIKIHSEFPRDHSYTKVFSAIQEEARKSVIKLFSEIKPELKKLRSNIIQEGISMIKKIENVSKNALKELKICEANLNEIILEITQLKIIDNSKSLTFIESLLKLQPQNIEKIKSIRAPKLNIKSIDYNYFSKVFKLEPITECFDYQKNYYDNSRIIKFVWGNTNSSILGVFDAEQLKVYQHKLEWDHHLQSYGIKCLLPDGSFLYSKDRNLVIIDPIGIIKQIPPYKKLSIISAIYVGGCIFASFFGSINWVKYDIQKNKWISLVPILQSQGLCIACALFRNYIILGSDNSTKVIFYDMIINSFTEIPELNLKISTKKTITVHDRRVFVIDFSNFIYESTDNLMTWNAIKECSMMMPFFPIISWPIVYKENIYFSSNYGIYAFDIKENEIKSIVDFSFSKIQ